MNLGQAFELARCIKSDALERGENLKVRVNKLDDPKGKYTVTVMQGNRGCEMDRSDYYYKSRTWIYSRAGHMSVWEACAQAA